ncbi:MAG: xanthine dehydrogenase molybdopterin binding subunit, partial [Burkholderiaceae bacterium]
MNAPTPVTALSQAALQGQQLPHESAALHVSGHATYTDDLPELQGTLYAALITSPVAHGELVGEGIDRAEVLGMHGVVAVYTARDIPGENNCGPIVHDDPFLADGTVQFLGQPVAVVVARDMLYAREAAKRASVKVNELPAILTVEQAMAAQSVVMPSKTITRGQPQAMLAQAKHRFQGQTESGQQEPFY